LDAFSHDIQRPAAKELLQHRFIKGAKKTSYLTELIERYEELRARSSPKASQAYQPTLKGTVNWETNSTIRSDWNFDTIKTTSVMGTFSSAARDLLPEMDDEDMVGDDSSIYDEDEQSVDTGGAVKGSQQLAPGSLGMSQQAHSTVMIKPPPQEPDIPTLLATGDGFPSDSVDTYGPTTLPQDPDHGTPLEAPPAYTGSIRSVKRSSYAARHKTTGAGTIMREADLGSGVGTIRPVKKVDTNGSLRLSAEYVGTTRSRDDVPLSPSSTTSIKERSSFKRRGSEEERAGRAIVDDVVLPVLQNVSLPWEPASYHSDHLLKAIRDDMDARELESLSMISRGFADLRDANASLSYNVILDIISGINEYVFDCGNFSMLTVHNLEIPMFDSMFRLLVVYSPTSGSFAGAR
jgi:serine/threonine-protein kinase 24/25/MST4